MKRHTNDGDKTEAYPDSDVTHSECHLKSPEIEKIMSTCETT